MKYILNFIKGTLFTLWLIIAIFTTICLLSYNDYQVSEFGKYSLLIINNKELRSVYEQDSLVIIKKANEEDYKKSLYSVFSEKTVDNLYEEKIPMDNEEIAKIRNIIKEKV